MRHLVDGMYVESHVVEVPLDWSNPGAGGTIKLSVREVVAADKADDALPALCYLRGGPGFQAPPPISKSSWLAEYLGRYRVFLLDQRGTGRSTPVDVAIPAREPNELADYLSNFRADSIVRDAEQVRRALLGENAKWTVHGQSFGGFCALSYLSWFPSSLDAVVITGGFAPILRSANEVYRALAERVAERNDQFFDQFPGSRAAVSRIVDHLSENDVHVAPDWRLSARQFLTLGNTFGRRHGNAVVNEIVERCVADIDTYGTLTYWPVKNAADPLSLSTNPIYAVLHEAIYCQHSASNWAAAAAIEGDRRFGEESPPLFTGEMIFPWMFDELPALAPFKEAAGILAGKDDWPALYDTERLRANEVPVVGTIYYDDLYVDRDYALETATLVGNCGYWITNEYEHAAYDDDPKRVMGRLFDMLDERKAASRTRSLL